jgi:tetratricopeptide (TPR) repeat protein
MTRKNFSEIINCFQTPEEELLPLLETEVEQYPYSQTLWMLLAAGWALHDPLKFQQNLPKIATIIPSRTQLKDVVSRSIKKAPLVIPLFSIIENIHIEPPSEPENTFVPDNEDTAFSPSITEDYLQTLMNQLEEIENDISDFIDEVQHRPQPKIQETSSANIYDITKMAEIYPEKNTQSDTKKNETTLLIDRFLEKQPTISRTTGEFFNPENVIEQSIDSLQQPVSETLAVILSKQGQHQKAIEIYQKLILEIPEKSSYFAAQIQNLLNV